MDYLQGKSKWLSPAVWQKHGEDQRGPCGNVEEGLTFRIPSSAQIPNTSNTMCSWVTLADHSEPIVVCQDCLFKFSSGFSLRAFCISTEGLSVSFLLTSNWQEWSFAMQEKRVRRSAYSCFLFDSVFKGRKQIDRIKWAQGRNKRFIFEWNRFQIAS